LGLNVPVSHISWQPCWRILPSRFRPIELFERVADPADLEAIVEVEALTDDRIRHEVGELRLVVPEDRISGPGSSLIMAAFTHLNPAGSRFSDGRYGVFYAAGSLDTAVAETRYHRARFMRATRQHPMELDMNVYATDLDGDLHDIRGLRDALADVYDADDYSAGQQLGRTLRAQDSWGIAYESVRDKGGECVGVLRPPVLSHCRQARALCYVWDGNAISDVYEKRRLKR
jgi:hypothetical protein